MSASKSKDDGKIEATKTYLEQTKLLATLASAFLFAPAALAATFKDVNSVGFTAHQTTLFVLAEAMFIFSVVSSYIVIGSIAGSQDDGSFNVFRPATRIFSLLQFGFYICGIIIFLLLALHLIATPGNLKVK